MSGYQTFGRTRLIRRALFLTASSVAGILAQRLVRRICPHCASPAPPEPALLEKLGKGGLTGGEGFMEGRGCEACSMSGYRGRTGIFELMTMNDELRQLILRQTSAGVLREAAIRGGMRSIREDGVEKAARGLTTLAEVLRTTEEE